MSGQFCLLILYLVAICQMSSGPHGPIFIASDVLLIVKIPVTVGALLEENFILLN